MPWVNNRWVPENDSSVDKLNAITATDSPYMKLARSTAAETANSRGLINSSIAAGAGEAAAIAAASPFALQDAQLTGQKNLTFEQGGINSDLSAQEAGQSSSLSEQQAAQALKAQQQAQAAAADLSKQEYGQQGGLLSIQGQQSRDLATLNNDAQAGLTDKQITAQAGLTDKQIAANASLATTNNAAEMERTRAQLASQERSNATTALLNSDANYLSAFGNIAANDNIPAPTRDAYLENIAAIRTSGQDAVQQMYGVTLNWGSTPVPSATAASAAPAPANSNTKSTSQKIVSTLASPISTKTGRGLLTNGLSSLF